MVRYALIWWISLGVTVILLFLGEWGWAIAIFVLGNIIFSLGKGSTGRKVSATLRDDVAAVGFNDGSPRQVERARRAFRLLVVQSDVNPRYHLYPHELDDDVANWGHHSRSEDTPILLFTAWSIAAQRLSSSAEMWGQNALEVETEGLPVKEMDSALREAFPTWYLQNNPSSLPMPVAQRLNAYIFTLLAFAASRKDEILR